MQYNLRARQLNQLDKLLAVFQAYKAAQARALTFSLDLLALLSLSGKMMELEDILNHRSQGGRLEDIFTVGSTVHLDEVNQRELEVLTLIHAGMNMSFELKFFRFSNLFRKAQALMIDKALSADTAEKIIRLIQTKQSTIRQLQAPLKDIIDATNPNATNRDATTRTRSSEAYRSYQQEGPAPSVAIYGSTRMGLFDPQLPTWLMGQFVELELYNLSSEKAGRRGYTEIGSYSS